MRTVKFEELKPGMVVSSKYLKDILITKKLNYDDFYEEPSVEYARLEVSEFWHGILSATEVNKHNFKLTYKPGDRRYRTIVQAIVKAALKEKFKRFKKLEEEYRFYEDCQI